MYKRQSLDYTYTLFKEFLKFDPDDPHWKDRDRFLLSAGHESALNYTILTYIGWLNLDDLKWIIITSENAQEVFAKLEAAGIDPVLFGVTDKDFQILAKNFAQIRQKLQETTNLLQEYKKYYETDENSN